MANTRLALRAVCVSYADPFQKRRVTIRASDEWFRVQFGFGASAKAASSL